MPNDPQSNGKKYVVPIYVHMYIYMCEAKATAKHKSSTMVIGNILVMTVVKKLNNKQSISWIL